MTTLPDDVIEFLRQIADDFIDGGPYSGPAQRLLDKYTAKVGPREFKGTANETWALPPGAEGYKLNG